MVKDMRKKTGKELTKHIDKLRTDIAKYKRDKAAQSTSKNVAQLRVMKRELAVALTVANETKVDTDNKGAK